MLGARQACEAEITAIYAEHNPSKLDDVPTLLAKYRGKEEKLLDAIRGKYAISEPEPEPEPQAEAQAKTETKEPEPENKPEPEPEPQAELELLPKDQQPEPEPELEQSEPEPEPEPELPKGAEEQQIQQQQQHAVRADWREKLPAAGTARLQPLPGTRAAPPMHSADRI